ncbi:MAG: energy-coupling factor transporter ATPase [Firmicutes bacterium]|nr:energy-coupling factor transporter ATPase [Bacillota bacterium]
MVEFKNVSYYYNAGTPEQVRATKKLSFTIGEGEFVALVGHNGSGKSTVARLMNGLLVPQRGEVLVNGVSTSDNKKIFDVRKTVGVVFQNPDNQMIASIIEDDIAFGPENLGVPPSEIRERVDWALEAVGMSEHKRGTPFRLSGGQKQRIAIAGMLAIKPKVLVLDESTAMLDPIGREEVLKTAMELREKEGVSIVLITHFMEEAIKADKIIVLNGGAKVMEGGREILSMSEELDEIGLDAPFAARIARRLREKGVRDLDDGVYEIEELVKKLVNIE